MSVVRGAAEVNNHMFGRYLREKLAKVLPGKVKSAVKWGDLAYS